MNPPRLSRYLWWSAFFSILLVPGNPLSAVNPLIRPPQGSKIPAPELEGGTGWINSAGPIRMQDLRGKIVILDFWTLC